MSKTITEIIHEVTNAGKQLGRRQIYRYFDALKIQPLGTRQRPQRYPADTADRVLAHLGLNGNSLPTHEHLPTVVKPKWVEGLERKEKIMTLPQIKRAAKRKGGRK